MDFLHVFCYGHKSWNRSERLAHVVCVKTCYYNSFSLVGQLLSDLYEAFVEELRFVHTDYLGVFSGVQHL